jgi:chromosome partitioning protein
MEADEITRDTKVIALGNQKGGVGKTTNCVQVATALGEIGRKCLIWDLDMNFGATRHFGIAGGSYWGTFELLTGQDEIDNVLITENDEDVELPVNVHLITADRNLEGLDKALGAEHKFFPAGILLEPLRQLRGRYDYIFLDTAPSASTPTLAAYMASDFFILSTTPQTFAIKGLEDAVADIKAAIRQGNQKLLVLGVILSDVDKRLRLARLHMGLIEELFRLQPGQPSAKFETIISRSTIVGEAQKLGKTIFQTHPDHKVTDQYRALAQEVEARLAAFATHTTTNVPAQESPPIEHEQHGDTAEDRTNG